MILKFSVKQKILQAFQHVGEEHWRQELGLIKQISVWFATKSFSRDGTGTYILQKYKDLCKNKKNSVVKLEVMILIFTHRKVKM